MRSRQVALGEAGLGIVASNLKNEGSDFNPMIPGKKVMACFGFCDIRQFTQTTECLQEEVLVFVNNIADIVHQVRQAPVSLSNCPAPPDESNCAHVLLSRHPTPAPIHQPFFCFLRGRFCDLICNGGLSCATAIRPSDCD